jgi:hypothetical protein
MAVEPTNLGDLPFRVALSRELFEQQSVYPEIRSTGATERLSSIRSGDALLTILSPLEAAGLIAKETQFKIVSVLQSRPASLLVLGQETSKAQISLKQDMKIAHFAASVRARSILLTPSASAFS